MSEKKNEKVHLSVAIVPFGMYMHSDLPLWHSRSQGHLVTLAKDHISVVCQHFQKGFSFEITGPISFKFHMQPSSKRGKKVYTFGVGHMTKMAAMPICGKDFKKKSLEPLCRLP